MGHNSSSRVAKLLSLSLTAVLLLFATCGTGANTRESQLSCLPREVESRHLIRCVIQVRDDYQEPTTDFNLKDFTVFTRTSNAQAAVEKSKIALGSDKTTAFFTLSASTTTDILIQVYSQKTSATHGTSDLLEIRGSGITASVLSWPTSRLGPISCSAESAGLALRSSTVCRSTLHDPNNSLSVVHPADVILSEANEQGSLVFISGKRELVFRFTAPPKTPTGVSTFTLQVRLRNEDEDRHTGKVQEIQFPVLYPHEVALAAATSLQCSAEARTPICRVTAADALGPVLFHADQFRVRVERLVETVAGTTDGLSHFSTDSTNPTAGQWADVTETLSLSLTRSPFFPYVGVVSWTPKSNDVIYKARLRVLASTDRQEIGGTPTGDITIISSVTDVVSSPYPFTMGTLPDMHSVKLRSCRKSVILSGKTTVCFIDLQDGVSGDISYYLIKTSQQQSFVSNVTYVAHDDVCMCPSLWFTYHAPTAPTSRVDDRITLSVYTDVERSVDGVVLVNTSVHLSVFPRISDLVQGTSSTATNTVVAVVGLLFFGGVLGVGCVLIVRRSRKASRIRHQRALKEQGMLQDMVKGNSEPNTNTVSNTRNLNPPAAVALAAESTELAIAVEDGVGVRGGAGPNISGYGKVTIPDTHAREADGLGNNLSAPTVGAISVVSNVASPQDRFHSDSD